MLLGAVCLLVTFSAILFDLDGTLCEGADSAAAIYGGAFETVDIDPFGTPEELWTALDDPPDHDDPVGYLAAGFVRVAAQHGRTPVDATALAEGFLDAVEYANVTPKPGAVEAVGAAASTARIGLVTNGPASRQAGKLDALPFGDAFGTVVYADDLPRRKPNREPFDRALSELSLSPENALYVGNSLEYDVAGAQNAGLEAAWCPNDGRTDPAPYRPEYVLESLADFQEVLGAER